jgi:hypothetical protein
VDGKVYIPDPQFGGDVPLDELLEGDCGVLKKIVWETGLDLEDWYDAMIVARVASAQRARTRASQAGPDPHAKT